MSPALRVEFDVSARSGVDALKGSLNLPGRSRTQLNLSKYEAELPISAQATGRQNLCHDAFQARALGQDQLMVGGKDGLGYHGFDRRASVVGRRAQGRDQPHVHVASR